MPDQNGVRYAEQFGFYPGSIAVWDTTSTAGVERVGSQFNTVMDTYFHLRSSGVRGTKNLFNLDPAKITSKTNLKEIPASSYEIFPVRQEQPIREFVESWTKEKYRLGSAYYQPTKPVKVQDYKKILVQDQNNGRVYEGAQMRQLLGLPDYTVEVNPLSHPNWRMFIQSASVNRKLFPNTFVLVRR